MMLDLNYFLPNNYSNLGVVFLVGLVAGISTCGGLLSSFILGISAKNIQTNLNFWDKIKPHLIFNLGRVFFFTFFGFLAGILGQYLILNNFLIGTLILIASFYLLLLGIKLLKISKLSEKIDLSSKVLGKLTPKFIEFKEKSISSNIGLFLLGGITFFLPCGFTQAIQIFTLTLANPFYSALTLFVFALGTMPGLLAFASATSLIKGKYSDILFRVIGLIVIYFSLVNIFNSISLIGINPFVNYSNSQSFNIKNGYQEISMIQTHKGYEPNLLIVKKGIPVKLTVNSKNNTTCASYLVMDKFNVRVFLELGDNMIEFTPTELGDYQFSCGMGMHPGIVRVVE